MVRAWKWGAGSLSAGAALVSIISSVRSATGAQQVRWIGVAPAADTAFAIGDTIQLASTITDGHGGVLPGVSVGWSSTDTSVAVVDSAGTVVVQGAGATTVVAAAGGRIAQSRILVRPRAAAIRIHGDTLVRLPEGGTSRIVARVVDARRYPVPGQSIAWRSVDPSVVVVDSLARLTAVSAGRTTIAATGGDVSAELSVEVYPVPASITLLAGDNQRAPAGRRLPNPLRAQIVSRGGRPLAGVAVRIGSAEDGAGVQQTDTSDADGMVELFWTLGARPGRQRIPLSVDGEASVGTIVAAEADPLPGNTRIGLVGATPIGRVGAALTEPTVVRLTDSADAPLPGVPIAWTANEGGTIVAEEARTDSAGTARARWTLGARSGRQQAFVQVGSPTAMPRFAIEASALPGAPAALSLDRGAPSRGAAGRTLTAPIVFHVSDRHGNAVPGVPVAVRTASGSVGERSIVSDSAGRVALEWTLGTAAGSQRLTATAPGVERAAEVVLEARAGGAKRVALEGLPPSATAGRPLAAPIAITVSDSFRNPVVGATVMVATRSGRVSPASARTDASGRVLVRWTLGNTPGEQQIVATVKGTERRAVGKLRTLRPGTASTKPRRAP
ncbi:MAG TPA: Ig-like domain-containing protein [Gemmatimonadales bacterium]|nr:Ig-like domain-containing protein [Gemmatimonadales bacterium]